MEVLFTLFSEHYETGSVMITKNLPFSQWEQTFKDPTTTAAATDRLVYHTSQRHHRAQPGELPAGSVTEATEGISNELKHGNVSKEQANSILARQLHLYKLDDQYLKNGFAIRPNLELGTVTVLPFSICPVKDDMALPK